MAKELEALGVDTHDLDPAEVAAFRAKGLTLGRSAGASGTAVRCTRPP